jgi:tetratricopeptide (TPR) repeat protein/tRNA A-37 threonylcarbamoyl transferase component Bud32
VPSDLRDRLQHTLGTAYTLERELGGGGMSRVFVAEETALNRKVVVKVLPPDLAAGVSVDRFKREIQVAAGLHHPHIVPVLAAGETDGLPFYTMPFVEGESLRGRLARGALPITEAVGVLRDVAKALAFAHQHSVVHRDIKPDNVMITGSSASVTDFGIAKAISAARGEASNSATLTQMGTSLGTPAYMSPEQAAGDPTTNHRTDIYSFGVMAYEVLAGRPPFHALTPQKLLAAHMSERPAPISDLRPDIPQALAELVMRCLEKDADQRPQNAALIAQVLEGAATSGSAHTAMPSILLGGRGMLKKALGIYAASFVAVAVLARAAIVGIGLPDWVFPGSLIVMALGLPVILFTAFVHKETRRAATQTPTLTPGGTRTTQSTMATIAIRAAPHMSWRRTAIGGLYSVGAFVALIAVWMLMRGLGIGPAGSLMAAGKMGQRERIILGEFKSPAADSMLGITVTEAFRTDIAQSPNLNLMPASTVRDVLRRMQKPEGTHVDLAVAREVANREGIKAVIDGDIVSLGGSYVLSARLVAAQSGEELATTRETAADAKDIIPAISKLTKQLRSRIGESLRSVQNARTLDKVTTASMEALQKYVAGARAIELEGDFSKGQPLLEDAITLDTGFAMAYRKLAVELNNRGLQRERVKELMQKAYNHRDRLSDAERYITLGSYYRSGPTPDRAKVISAYESLLDLDPDNVTALNNLSAEYSFRRDFVKAEQLVAHAVEIQPTASVFFNNLFDYQVAQGKLDKAEQTLDLAAKNLPRNPAVPLRRADLAYSRAQYDGAAAAYDSLMKARANDLSTRRTSLGGLSNLASLRGRLTESERLTQELRQIALTAGNRQAALNGALDHPDDDAWYRDKKDQALRAIDRALVEHPLDSLPLSVRPYGRLVSLYSLVGRPDRAKAMLQGVDQQAGDRDATDFQAARHSLLGDIAIAEKRYDDAAREYRAGDVGDCMVCALPNIARAYDLAGNADSAIAIFSRYTDGSERDAGSDQRYLPARTSGSANSTRRRATARRPSRTTRRSSSCGRPRTPISNTS